MKGNGEGNHTKGGNVKRPDTYGNATKKQKKSVETESQVISTIT